MKRSVTVTSGSPPKSLSINPLDRFLQLLMSIKIFRFVILTFWAFSFAIPLNLFMNFIGFIADILVPSRRAAGMNAVTSRAITNKLLTMTDHGQHHWITVNSTRYHYVQAGNASKFMLLLHGGASHWYGWWRQLDEFSDDYTVVAIDMKGFLGTDLKTSISDLHYERVSNDIHDIIASLAPPSGKVTLVGHDFGGVAAFNFATFYPFDIEKLVIINSFFPPQFYRQATLWQILLSSYMPFMAMPFMANWSFGRFNGAPLNTALISMLGAKEAPYFTAPNLQPGALRAGLNWYRSLLWDIIQGRQVEPMNVQTLILYGERDFAISPVTAYHNYEGDVIANHALTVRVIPKGGHFLHQMEPDATNLAIRQFLGYTATNFERSGANRT